MIFVVGGRGGGGLSTSDALLHINAPVGSTITLAKGGVTVATLSANNCHANSDGIMANWYYSISSSNYGTWTISAMKDGQTTTGTITVDSVKQYDIELTYNLYLIKNGVIKASYGKTGSDVVVTELEDYVSITFKNNSRAFWIQLTSDVLDGIKYRTLVVDFEDIRETPNTYIVWGIRTAKGGTYGQYWLANLASSNDMTFPNHSEIDISSVSYEDNYFMIWCRYATRTCDVINVYLKR